MEDYIKVGFNVPSEDTNGEETSGKDENKEMVLSIP